MRIIPRVLSFHDEIAQDVCIIGNIAVALFYFGRLNTTPILVPWLTRNQGERIELLPICVSYLISS